MYIKWNNPSNTAICLLQHGTHWRNDKCIWSFDNTSSEEAFDRYTCRWWNYIKFNGGVDCINFVQDKDKRPTFVGTAMNLQVWWISWIAESLLTAQEGLCVAAMLSLASQDSPNTYQDRIMHFFSRFVLHYHGVLTLSEYITASSFIHTKHYIARQDDCDGHEGRKIYISRESRKLG
jgi:hypothetical protein